MMAQAKPHIPARCVPFLLEIDRYIRQYDMRRPAMASAASDVLDGLAMRHELEPLVRRRLLSVTPYCAGRPAEGLCGRDYSVHLTERAMRTLWPTRAAGAQGSQHA